MRVACPVDSMDYIKKNAEEAESLIFFDIEEDEILSEEKIDVIAQSIIPLLKTKDAEVFICANLDIPMMVQLSTSGIEIVGGTEGKAKNVLRSWLDGTLESSDIVCSGKNSGGCNGDCSHCKSI
ncbi:MAG: NifB/NifX family molybdenum-iron cluster-binding protein [Candidatus Ornithospirochaeta sp.]